jgi:hypothetical protein
MDPSSPVRWECVAMGGSLLCDSGPGSIITVPVSMHIIDRDFRFIFRKIIRNTVSLHSDYVQMTLLNSLRVCCCLASNYISRYIYILKHKK